MITQLDWKDLIVFDRSPQEILANRQSGRIYSADFKNGTGKYISSIIDGETPVDAVIKISPKIEIRLTYIISDQKVKGLQVTKLSSSGDVATINLTTLEWEGILQLLQIFSVINVSSIASGSLILDKSIIGNEEELQLLLNTIASDPNGRKKLAEVTANFGLLTPGDIYAIAHKKSQIEIMDKLLNNTEYFQKYKTDKNIGKEEEVWQQFFQENSWMLGSEVVRVLEDRHIDEESISDLPVEGYDGFLDIVELKLPEVAVWTKDLYPTSEITKAIMQCMGYITEYERRMNDGKKLEALGISILKPRINLIIGRSKEWNEGSRSQFRILNSSFHNITILTYDQVLERANRLINIES